MVHVIINGSNVLVGVDGECGLCFGVVGDVGLSTTEHRSAARIIGAPSGAEGPADAARRRGLLSSNSRT